jgi:hypothetical protein
MTDDDDFITVNITCDQSAVLVVILLQAVKLGLFDSLPSELQPAMRSFLVKMMIDGDCQAEVERTR